MGFNGIYPHVGFHVGFHVEHHRKNGGLMGFVMGFNLGEFDHELTVLPHWKSWLVRGIIPKWPNYSG